jgi:hypothetical protein
MTRFNLVDSSNVVVGSRVTNKGASDSSVSAEDDINTDTSDDVTSFISCPLAGDTQDDSANTVT